MREQLLDSINEYRDSRDGIIAEATMQGRDLSPYERADVDMINSCIAFLQRQLRNGVH